MNPLEILRERKEHRINERIAEAAGTTAVVIYNGLHEGEAGPYCVPIGTTPEGIETDTYVERVQQRTLEILGGFGCGHRVEYDPRESDEASTQMVKHGVSYIGDRDARNLLLVFRQA